MTESFLRREDIPYKLNFQTAKRCSIKVGGEAKIAAFPKNCEQLIKLLQYFCLNSVRYCIVGKSSNMYFSDDGYDGVAVYTTELCAISERGGIFRAECGASLPALIRRGAECALEIAPALSGIPGSIGGALKGNAGAFGAEFSDIFIEGEFYDTECCEFITLKRCDLDFSYRSSLLKQRPLVFISGTVRANPSEREKIIEKISYYSTLRRNAHPHEPSLGSFFKKKGDISPALLIDKLRLKGFTVGGAQVSTKHAGFIINKNNATASDVNALADIIEKKVFDAYGVRLERETVFVE